jgi:hypothetical protein
VPKADIGAFAGTSSWGADDWKIKNFCSLSSMTTRPERFRVKAIECSIAAQKTQDRKPKRLIWNSCAGELADEIEHFEHSWLDSGGS